MSPTDDKKATESSIQGEQEFTLGESKLKRLIKRVSDALGVGKNLQNDPSKQSYFLAYVDDLSDVLEEIHNLADQLHVVAVKSQLLDGDKRMDTIDAQVEKAEALFYEAKAIRRDLESANKSNVKVSSGSVDTSSHVKLPQIKLPHFSGRNLVEWTHFKDLFTSLIIDNKTLSNIERFQYLISCLSEPALGLVTVLQVTNDNFQLAWDSLISKYDSIRLLAYTHFEKIVNYPPLKGKPNLETLQSYLNTIKENVVAFHQLKLADESDFLLLNLALRSLDGSSKTAFEREYSGVDIPKFDDLIKFLENSCHVMELSSLHDSTGFASQPKCRSGKSHINLLTKNMDKACQLCRGTHYLASCPSFMAMKISQRHGYVKTNGLCYNCLNASHRVIKCPSQGRCKQCNKLHHSMLHFDSSFENAHNSSGQSSSENLQHGSGDSSEIKTVLSSFAVPSSGTVLLGTAIVRMTDVNGKPQKIRLVVDSGSQLSFITEECANRLGLSKKAGLISVSGLNEIPVSRTNKRVKCSFTSRFGSDVSLTTEAIVIPAISANLPCANVPIEVSHRLAGLKLADPTFWKSGKVDFLLGSDLFMQILPKKPRPSPIVGHPQALDTILGWIVMGHIDVRESFEGDRVSLFVNSTETLMEKFWELEEPAFCKVSNPEHEKCEQHFVDTHYRDASGRYVVALPFKQVPPEFSESATLALHRFIRLEKKLNRVPELKCDYHQFMNEYLELGHMSPFLKTPEYVIPHHAVVKPESISTKLRVVFDASAKSVNGSLNDYLFPGPKLQLNICDIVLNFRLHKIAFTADICKMYRQILIRPEDRRFQCVFWRDNEFDEIKTFELNTVTYGVSSAPFLALRVLHQLVLDEGAHYPLAAAVLRNSIYVDDIVTGCESLEGALSLRNQLLAQGGFELKKRTSNSTDFLKHIPEGDCACDKELSGNSDDTLKILGLQWSPKTDQFNCKVPKIETLFTKRIVLSTIARIFDPLGWLSPLVFLAKYIMQQTWLAKIGWDDELPSPIGKMWRDFVEQLCEVSKIQIPRYLQDALQHHIRILAFCDASERGYSAVVYVQFFDEHQRSNLFLLKAKTRLAPLKTISIPRLELCAAYLLSQVVESLAGFFEKLKNFEAFYWSDSTTVLSWLQTSPHLLKTFVANRVTKIIERTNLENWFYVKSQDNPADCASRGLNPITLVEHKLWWHGPSWIKEPYENWPLISVKGFKSSDIPELREIKRVTLFTTPENKLYEWMTSVSSFMGLLRKLAWVLRFITNLRVMKSKRNLIELQVEEMKAAQETCIRLTQEVYFGKELQALKGNVKPANLQRLAPFLDESGLIRVGGRLRNSKLPYEAKFPILLPQKSHFTKLLINHYHLAHGHAGPQLLQALLNRAFWIVSARQIIRQTIFRCTICYRLKAAPIYPPMGDLPSYRCQQNRPFEHVGVDFAGPFFIKDSVRKNAKVSKAYLCLFVCMCTKAVHLESVSALSTEAFMASLERFIARRGLCSHIYSDCGRNFLGASRTLNELYEFFADQKTNDKLQDALLPRGIKWRFNPPSAPHFGGIWEAGVKSCKYHLVRIVGDRALTFEELSTLFARVEAILNSRPLCALSSSPNEVDVLTPGHFLIGGPLLGLPEHNIMELNVNRLSRWQLVQQMTQHLWSRWHSEYLSSLQTRSKWTKEISPIVEGMVVLLRDSNTSPLHWKYARVAKVHPGADGVVRVATLMTAAGRALVRPVVKLLPLPGT